MHLSDPVGWQFDHSYTRLPDYFYAPASPEPVRSPRTALVNHALADSLGLNTRALSGQEAAALFSGNILPGTAQPIAQAYAGHQFGHFTMLGDGRAILLGEHLTPDGSRFDIQFKGSGRTPFSRRGDGRAALGPMLREYIISEAMHALGIPTTRSLAVVTTGEPVMRETLLPGAILTRVAASHVRVGTFEYIARKDGRAGIRILADYVIRRHFPDLAGVSNPYLSLLEKVIQLQATLIAKWMLYGFIHGVMNTDNMSISGETIDYGPCAFMDSYDPDTVFSSIDQQGRYRYQNQPLIAQWNLARFAETLLPLIHPVQDDAVTLAEAALQTFMTTYQTCWITGMRSKLGLLTDRPEDGELIETLLTWMHTHHADYTATFRALSAGILPETFPGQDAGFSAWFARWQTRLSFEPGSKEELYRRMQSVNPAVIPRNHLVEAALSAAVEHEDYSFVHQLLEALANPFSDDPEYQRFSAPPVLPDHNYQTFCGT